MVLQSAAVLTYPQEEDHPTSIEGTCGKQANPLDVVGFLDRHYGYKSVATQIPHNAWLASIPYTGTESVPHRDRFSVASRSTSPKHQALNCLVRGPGQ